MRARIFHCWLLRTSASRFSTLLFLACFSLFLFFFFLSLSFFVFSLLRVFFSTRTWQRVPTLHRRTDSSRFSDFAEKQCRIFLGAVVNTTESRRSFLFESRTATGFCFGLYFNIRFISFRNFCYFYLLLFFSFSFW